MIIEVKNFSFAYADKNNIIDNLSFSLNKGELMLLTGDNGCGKSTLLRALKKEIAPKGNTKGEIIVNGSCDFLFQQCDKNVIFKNPYEDLIFPACNMGIPQNEIEKSAEEIISLFSISDIMSRDTDKLSGGEKQILSLASLLITHPDLLLLDEPLSQLDENAKKTFIDKIKLLKNKYSTTIIIAEHNTDDLLEMSDKVLIFNNKKTVCCSLKSIHENMVLENFPEYIKAEMKLNVKLKYFTKSEACENLKKCENLYKISPKIFNEMQQEPILKCKNISFSYDHEVLKNLDLTINKGEIAFLTGKNGAGKSTLFKIICSFLKPKNGKIEKEKFVKLGYLSQDPTYSFLKDTIKEDFDFLLKQNSLNEQTIDETFEKFPMYKDIKKLYDMNPLDLSGGEEAKCAMFKLLLIKRNLILLDEPEKHLDKTSCSDLSDAIKQLSKSGISFLIISHSPDFIYSTADSIKYLSDGKISNLSPKIYFENYALTSLRRVLKPSGIKLNCVDEMEVIENE